MENKKLKVLFLCIGNSCRSQMAEGLLKTMSPDKFEVHSAGSFPSGVNPIAALAMKEIGIDISMNRSKSVDEYEGQYFDYVITLCPESENEYCPVFVGDAKNRLHWGYPDPIKIIGTEEDILKGCREVRDQIRGRIEELCASLKKS